MTDFLKVIILGVIQGLTEFLPVSSSGHLVLGKYWLGITAPGASLEIALHGGTLLSILVFYRRDLVELVRRTLAGERETMIYVITLVVSAIPAIMIVVTAGEALENTFAQPEMAGIMLCLTGLVLFSLYFVRVDEDRPVTIGKGLLIGCAQALALLPGISRSGMTITLGRHLKLAPRSAARFSLLMAVPLLIGALVLESLKVRSGEDGDLGLWLLTGGAAVAAIVGYLAIVILIRTLADGRFWLFGIYCLVLGILSLLLLG